MDNQPTDPNSIASGNPQAPSAVGVNSGVPTVPTAAEVAQQKLEQLQNNTQEDNGTLSVSHEQPKHEVKREVTIEEDDGTMVVQRSKHQLYMNALKASGKTLAEIQTAWHNYYSGLTDTEKHEVWREFYEADKKAAISAKSDARTEPANSESSDLAANFKKSPTLESEVETFHPSDTSGESKSSDATEGEKHGEKTAHHTIAKKPTATTTQAAGEADDKPKNSVPAGINEQADQKLAPDEKASLLKKLHKRVNVKARQQIHSLLFGLACGTVAVVVVLFGFFNEVIIAPFIQPSRTVNNTPIIIGTDGLAPTDKAEVIIPKINVEIPLDFSAKTLKEEDIQRGLENGVVHYPSTPLPGQVGNTSFFGHSSNNIFNSGKYKFAFVLLHELQIGDTFYLTRNGVAYAYQVFDKKVVEPNNVGILNPIAGKTATATLITCDPPGTTLRRLVVIGEQVSPAPGTNQPGGIQTAKEAGAKALPGNGPTLWQRFTKWFQ